MKAFSLSSLDSLPLEVVERGRTYAIRFDYRAVLRIFRMLNDPEIIDEDKPNLLRKMFFVNQQPKQADAAFEWFVRLGQEGPSTGSGERDFDFEQDAKEIYSAFRQVYGIDLLEIEVLHWWRFSALLEGLFFCSNALSAKVKARHMDDSDAQRKAALERQKNAVKLCENVSRTDAAIEKELQARLLTGQPIDDLIKGGK